MPRCTRRPLQAATLVALVAGLVVALATTAAGVLGAPDIRRVPPPSGAAGFGASVAVLGDLDGDGAADAVVGAPGSGHAYVVSGTGEIVLHDLADPRGPGSRFGLAVASVDDVNGDGAADLAVGAPSGGAPTPGRAFVFSGASGALLAELASPAGDNLAFGSSVAGTGDVSGDGVADIVVTAPPLAGAVGGVFAFSGADGAQLWSRTEPVAQSEQPGLFGATVGVTSDVSGDGIADLLVSSPSRSPTTEPQATGDLVTDTLAGVLNLVTRVVSPATPGRVYLISGADGAVVRVTPDPVPQAGDRFGAALAAIGDDDGDGVVDHLIGEGGASQVHVYSGRDGRLLRSVATPAAVSPQGSMALAPAGDVDGDGHIDAWLGVPWARTVYLVNGAGTLLTSAAGSAQGSFGASVATLGLGGGGVDVIVGDPTEPGGGAAYFLDPAPAARAVAAGGQTDRLAECTGASCTELVALRAQTPVSTTTSTLATTTTVPTTATLPMTADTNGIPPTAVLPKPAAAATTDPALPDTGGADRSEAGLLALALGLAGLTVLRGRPRPRHGERSSGR